MASHTFPTERATPAHNPDHHHDDLRLTMAQTVGGHAISAAPRGRPAHPAGRNTVVTSSHDEAFGSHH